VKKEGSANSRGDRQVQEGKKREKKKKWVTGGGGETGLGDREE